MENSRKNLKILSVVMLILAGLSLARIATEVVSGFRVETIPLETTRTIYLVSVVIAAIISAVLVVPQIYIGVKGIKVSKNPDSSNAHIVWARILLVLAIIAVVICVVRLVKSDDLLGDILATVDAVVDVILYISFIKYASEVRDNA